MKSLLKKGESITIDLECLDELRKNVSSAMKEEFGYHTRLNSMEIKRIVRWSEEDYNMTMEFSGYNIKKDDFIRIGVSVSNLDFTWGDVKWASVVEKPIDL